MYLEFSEQVTHVFALNNLCGSLQKSLTDLAAKNQVLEKTTIALTKEVESLRKKEAALEDEQRTLDLAQQIVGAWVRERQMDGNLFPFMDHRVNQTGILVLQ